jgi:hypothetical protein
MIRGLRAALAATLLAVVGTTGCGYDVETIERVLVLQDRDLTGAGPLRAQRREAVDAQIAAIGLPLGTPSDRRLCGGMIGNSNLPNGTKREAIRSSAEKWTDSNFFLTFSGSPGGTLERQLFQASARHDFCYGHGVGSSGRVRTDCDRDFFADIDRLCRGSDEVAKLGRAGQVDDDTAGAACRSRAFWMKAAVDVFGGGPYGDNLLNTCDNDLGAQPPRDQLVVGRFLSGRRDQQLLEIRAVRDLRRLELVLHVHDNGAWRRSPPVPINLADIELREGETGGALDCRPGIACPGGNPAPDRLADLFGATALLSYAPIVMDIDGSKRDAVVLFGLHYDRDKLDVLAPDRSRKLQMGWGPVFVPLRITAALRNGDVSLAIDAVAMRPGGPRTPPGLAKADMRSNIDRFQHRLHVAQVFPAPVRSGDLTCGAGQQIVAPYLGTAPYNRAQIELRTFEFCLANGRVRRMVSYNWEPMKGGKYDSEFWGSPDNDGQFELYRRFQYPPRMMATADGHRTALHFFFRSKCDGPAGRCYDRQTKDLFDLDDMLVHRLVPVPGPPDQRVPRDRPAPLRSLTWRLHDWGAEGAEPCFTKSGKSLVAKTASHPFGCFEKWDRLGHPMSPIADVHRGPAPLLGAYLTNCALAATDALGTCDPKVAPLGHERLRLVLAHPADKKPARPVFADLDSPALRAIEEQRDPRLAASYHAYPTLALSFGVGSSGLVFLRAGDDANPRDDDAWTVTSVTQFRPDAGVTRPRSLRLLIAAMRGDAARRVWTAGEFTCALPSALSHRRWPLRAVPSLVLDDGAGASTIVLAIRPDQRELELVAIPFNGATPRNVAGSACTRVDAAGWTITEVTHPE